MRLSLLLPLLASCAGVYAEVAATSYPSATAADASVSASSVGFNVGADFGTVKRRLAIGYASESISVGDAKSTLTGADLRFDFNALSVNDRARVRIGLGTTFGDNTVGAVAGVAFSYFLTWHIALHGFVGARVLSDNADSADVVAKGVTFRVAATYQFRDVRPSPDIIVPLDNATDITGVLEAGATSIGCTSNRSSQPASGYASLSLTCDGREVDYFQIAEGMLITCHHMFAGECRELNAKILAAAKR